MCEDLENKAQDHAMWVLCDITDDNLTLDSVRQMLAEAYKQGYRDAQSPSTIYRRIPNIRGRVERMQIQHRLNNLNNK